GEGHGVESRNLSPFMEVTAMEAQKKPVATAHTQNEPQTDIEETIRIRAYELYEGRGQEHGHDIEDWLQAETELGHQRTRTIAA
ncbi:MAG TPA: DUF2934 domain-containing protein, partial [Candidatus Angelobacter sp.]